MQDTMPLTNNLITGIGSGLGQYLYENMSNTVGMNRKNFEKRLKGEYNTIVHCAFNTNSENIEQFLYDNVILTRKLCDTLHKKYIYISSIDVYQDRHNEYNTAKKMAEIMVQKYSKNYLIIRCSAILGETMRENSFLKIYRYMNPDLTLHANSTFNYVLQDDIMGFVADSIERDHTGIVDFVSSTNIRLFDVNRMLNNNANFGKFKYRTPNIDNSKLIELYPDARKTSEQAVSEYIKK